ALVVDEADMTLDMGFIEEVDQIAATLSPNSQLLVFSATILQKLQPFLQKYMTNPIRIEVENTEVISDLIDICLISTKCKKHKEDNSAINDNSRVTTNRKSHKEVTYHELTRRNPYLVLICANTKETVEQLTKQVNDRGLDVGLLHGRLGSRERRRAMPEIHN